MNAWRRIKTWQEGISLLVAVSLVLVSAVTALAAGQTSGPAPLTFFSGQPTPTDTATPTPTATSDTSPIDTPTFIPTDSPTPVPPSDTPTPTLTPSSTPTHTATLLPPIGPTSTPTPTSVPRPTLTPTPVPTPLPPTGFYYTVRSGDNLFRIALRFGTTIQAIAQANGIVNPRLIYVGQVLWIPTTYPGPPTNPTIYVVQPGDTLYSIARRFGTTYQVLAAVNGIANPRLIYVGQRLIIPGSGAPVPTPTPPPQIYVVQPGDTLWSIALRFGTSPWAIAVINGLRNPNLIYVGQRLIIP